MITEKIISKSNTTTDYTRIIQVIDEKLSFMHVNSTKTAILGIVYDDCIKISVVIKIADEMKSIMCLNNQSKIKRMIGDLITRYRSGEFDMKSDNVNDRFVRDIMIDSCEIGRHFSPESPIIENFISRPRIVEWIFPCCGFEISIRKK